MSDDADDIDGPYELERLSRIAFAADGSAVGFGFKLVDGPTVTFEAATETLEEIVRELQAVREKARQLVSGNSSSEVTVPFPIVDMQLGHDAENDQLILRLRSDGSSWLGSFVSHDLIAGLFDALRTLLPRSPGLNRAMEQLRPPMAPPERH